MPEQCPQLKTQLQNIKSLFGGFSLELEQAKINKDFDKTLSRKEELESNIKELSAEIEILTDPYQPDFRYDLAQRLDLRFIGLFKDGLASAQDKNDRWYFIDRQGNPVFTDKGENEDGRFYEARSFSEGLAEVQVDWNSGCYFINKQGESVFGDRRFRFAHSFSQGLAAVQDSEDFRWCFINRQGKPVFTDKGENEDGKFGGLVEGGARSFSEGLAVVQDKRGWHYFIDQQGNCVFKDKNNKERRFASVESFSEGLAVVSDVPLQYYFINQQGDPVFGDRKFKSAESFSEGLAMVKDKSGWYFIDRQGQSVFGDRRFRGGGSFSEGLAAVQFFDGQEFNYYFIDRQGKPVFKDGDKDKKFKFAENFSEGLAKVKDASGEYYIDHKGRRIGK